MAQNKNQIMNIRKIASLYAGELEKRGVKPSKIILYGSFARGKGGKYSDIDFAIISPQFAKMKPLKKLEFLSLATKNIDAPIEAVGYTPEEISRRGKQSIFWDEVTRNGKVVYSKN